MHHKKYSLIICGNTPLSYFYDMYKIYTNLNIDEITIETLRETIVVDKNIEQIFLQDGMHINIKVPKLIDPKLWLYKPFQNIIAYRYKKANLDESLEIYVNLIDKTLKYYVLGSKLLLSTTNINDTIMLHKCTIDMLLERSIFCDRPFIHEIGYIFEKNKN